MNTLRLHFALLPTKVRFEIAKLAHKKNLPLLRYICLCLLDTTMYSLCSYSLCNVVE